MRYPLIGILGGGQLGRMMALAGHKIGIGTRIFDPAPDCPAGQVSQQIVAPFDDLVALKAFCKDLDCVTFEFENVPISTIQSIEENNILCAPSSKVLTIAQDRVLEKSFFNRCDVATAKWHAIVTSQDIENIALDFTFPAILKTNRMGYDGKGQLVIKERAQVMEAWNKMECCSAILEEKCMFRAEISVLVACNGKTDNSDMIVFEPAQNTHKDGILSKSIVPGDISDSIKHQAVVSSKIIAKALNLQGILAIEYFVMPDGSLLANEMAPRPHNSGHWTMDGAQPCQFTIALLASLGMPLPKPKRFFDMEMINLIGDEVKAIDQYRHDLDAFIHLYGKGEIRSGRKMGHINIRRAFAEFAHAKPYL